jgi:NTE family protein
MGAIYASDPDANLDIIAKDFYFRKLVRFTFDRSAIIQTSKIREYIQEIVRVDDFKDLKMPLSVNATNIKTGDEVVFRSGHLVTALIASISVPGLFPAVNHDGKVLFDGSLVNNVPVSSVRSADSYIISDISIPLSSFPEKPNKLELLQITMTSLQNRITRTDIAALKRKKIVNIHQGKKFHILDFRHDNLIALMQHGYDETMKRKEELLKLVK